MKLKVPEMSCGHCAKTIEGAVKAIDPAANVQVDLATSTVTVASNADEAKLAAAIKDAGYDNHRIAAEAGAGERP